MEAAGAQLCGTRAGGAPEASEALPQSRSPRAKTLGDLVKLGTRPETLGVSDPTAGSTRWHSRREGRPCRSHSRSRTGRGLLVWWAHPRTGSGKGWPPTESGHGPMCH